MPTLEASQQAAGCLLCLEPATQVADATATDPRHGGTITERVYACPAHVNDAVKLTLALPDGYDWTLAPMEAIQICPRCKRRASASSLIQCGNCNETGCRACTGIIDHPFADEPEFADVKACSGCVDKVLPLHHDGTVQYSHETLAPIVERRAAVGV